MFDKSSTAASYWRKCVMIEDPLHILLDRLVLQGFFRKMSTMRLNKNNENCRPTTVALISFYLVEHLKI